MNYQAVQKREAFKIFIQYLFGKFQSVWHIESNLPRLACKKFQKLISIGTQIRAYEWEKYSK